MRIVHSIFADAGLEGSGNPYATTNDEPQNLWKGCRVEVLISSKDPLTNEYETIEIEGESAALKAALTHALMIVEDVEDYCRRQRASMPAEPRQDHA